MSLTPESQRRVIEYYFKEPNAKAVVEDGLGENIQDVRDFLKSVYKFLEKLHPETQSATKVVHKYELVTESGMVNLPYGAKILKIAEQHTRYFVWCLVNPLELEHRSHNFLVEGTGHHFREDLIRGDTYQETLVSDKLVLHFWIGLE